MPLGKADLGPRRDNFLGIGAETSRTGCGWLLHHASGHPCWWPLVVLSRTGDSGGHAISRGWERLEVAGGGRGGRGGTRGGPPPPPPPGGGRASDPPPRTPSSQPGGPLGPPDVLRNPQMLSKYVLYAAVQNTEQLCRLKSWVWKLLLTSKGRPLTLKQNSSTYVRIQLSCFSNIKLISRNVNVIIFVVCGKFGIFSSHVS